MRTTAARLVFSLGLVFSLSAQSQGMEFDKKALKTIGKAAIVSLTIDNLHEGENAHEKYRASNARFQKEAAAYALERYLAEFKEAGFWEIVPAPEPKELDGAFADLSNSQVAMDALMKLAEKNKLPGEYDGRLVMQYAMAQMKRDQAAMDDLKRRIVAGSAKGLQETYESAKAHYIWDEGLAFLPYAWALRQGGTSYDSVLRQVAEAAMKDYCAKHGLDAVIVLYLRSSTAEPGKGLQAVTVTTRKQAGRAVTAIKVNPTVVVRTQDGAMAVDGEMPRMDDLAPFKIVRGYQDTELDGKRGYYIDLDDPEGIAMKDYKALIDGTTAKLVKSIAKKAKK